MHTRSVTMMYLYTCYSLFQTFRQSTFCDSFYEFFSFFLIAVRKLKNELTSCFENNYLVFFTWRNVNLFNKKVNVNGILLWGKLGGSLCSVSSIRCRSSLSVLLLEQLQHLRERLKNIRQSLSYQNKHML